MTEAELKETGGVSQYTKVYCGWARGRLLECLATQRAAAPTTRRAHAHDTAVCVRRYAAIPAARRVGELAWRARHNAQGRAALCLRYGTRAPRHGSLRLRYGRAARPRYGAGLATTRPLAHGLARAVHLVHSACIWPDLTQYCS